MASYLRVSPCARARSSIVPPGVPDRHAIELQATKQDGPVRGAQVVRPPVAFWREILAKPQTQIVQGLEVRKKVSGALSTRLVKLDPVMPSTGAISIPTRYRVRSVESYEFYALELLPRSSRSENE